MSATLMADPAFTLVTLPADDLGEHLAFERPLNPILDLHLQVSDRPLLFGSVEPVAMMVAVTQVLLAALRSVVLRVDVARHAPILYGVFALPLPAAPLVVVTTPDWIKPAAASLVAGQVKRTGEMACPLQSGPLTMFGMDPEGADNGQEAART